MNKVHFLSLAIFSLTSVSALAAQVECVPYSGEGREDFGRSLYIRAVDPQDQMNSRAQSVLILEGLERSDDRVYAIRDAAIDHCNEAVRDLVCVYDYYQYSHPSNLTTVSTTYEYSLGDSKTDRLLQRAANRAGCINMIISKGKKVAEAKVSEGVKAAQKKDADAARDEKRAQVAETTAEILRARKKLEQNKFPNPMSSKDGR